MEIDKKVLISGNEAIGAGAIAAGCRFYAGYPITPQNELTAFMSRRMSEAGGVFIQAESELAAINMVLGASAAGARAMTSSSSPGISLKQEGISYMAGAELPAVIVNIMRGGPGLGNIAPSQADYFQATKGGGHGDYRIMVLAPSSVREMFEFSGLAFDLADKYRIPVMILGDGILGQMMEPVRFSVIGYRFSGEDSSRTPNTEPRTPKDWALRGCGKGEPKIVKSFRIEEGALEAHNSKLQKKYRTIERKEVLFETLSTEDARILVVAYGSMSRLAALAVEKARGKGCPAGFFKPVTLWPFPSKEILALSKKVKKILVVEMSAGQMREDVELAVRGNCPVELYARTGGGVPTEEGILRRITRK